MHGLVRVTEFERRKFRGNRHASAERPAGTEGVIEPEPSRASLFERGAHMGVEARREIIVYTLPRVGGHLWIQADDERLDLASAKSGLIQKADLAAKFRVGDVTARPPPADHRPIGFRRIPEFLPNMLRRLGGDQ